MSMTMTVPESDVSRRDEMQHVVRVARGTLYLPRETCETYFPGMDAVALICRDDDLLLLPLIVGSAGGLLLKVRNKRGDRVIHAQEFFRDRGFVEEFKERTVPARWDADAAALVISGVPRASAENAN